MRVSERGSVLQSLMKDESTLVRSHGREKGTHELIWFHFSEQYTLKSVASSSSTRHVDLASLLI